MSENNVTTDTEETGDGNKEKLEERALSVFSSERNEDMTALVLSLLTTFIVLIFTPYYTGSESKKIIFFCFLNH